MPNGAFRWATLKDIEITIRNNGGAIFGGYPRDRIIHDHYAEQFYAARVADSDTVLQYNNPEHHPESWPHRTVLPNDIDAYMPNDQMNHAIRSLKQKGYDMKVMFSGAAHIYGLRFNINPVSSMANELKLTRYELSFRLPDLLHKHMGNEIKAKMPNIQLDILHQPMIHDIKASFSPIDFECNSLIILPDNTLALRTASVSMPKPSSPSHPAASLNTINPSPLYSHNILNRIIQDIINFKAIAIQPQQHRIAKMIKKGFTLMAPSSVTLISQMNAPSYDGTCLVCHGALDQTPSSEPEIARNDPDQHALAVEAYNSAKLFHIKNHCCDARYHPACYKQSQDQATTEYDNVQKCMMCRTHLQHVYSPQNNAFCPLAEYTRSLIDTYTAPPPPDNDDTEEREADDENGDIPFGEAMFTPPHLVVISTQNIALPPPASVPLQRQRRRTNRILNF